MISDEMRELLSAYVDGELRDADAARVEEVSKRDPELRREIEAYRTLRRKLREWDAAEHGKAPSSTLVSRVLARARTIDAALAAPVRSGPFAPLAMAAALLLAVGAGYMIARSTAPGAPSLPAPGTPIALKPLDPLPDLALDGSALAPAAARAPAVVQRMRIYDHIPSRRAVELEETIRQELVKKATQPEPEGRTETPLSAEIRTMLEGCTARAGTRESLVTLAQPRLLTGIPSVEPAPSGRRLAMQDLLNEGRLIESNLGSSHVLSPVGEVWIVPRNGRTRVVTASEWVAPREDMFLRVTWGDIDSPKVTERFEVGETILGPKARRRILSAKTGVDSEFLAWLKSSYGASSLHDILAADKDRERAMNKLLDTLRADEGASGFAVFGAKGNLLGVEIFHDHAAMVGFAPRLLRGYLIEAGEDGIRLAPSVGDGRLAKVQDFLDGLPARSLRVEREQIERPKVKSTGFGEDEKWTPDGLCRVSLVAASGEVVGHGLLINETPIHLTLFGE